MVDRVAMWDILDAVLGAVLSAARGVANRPRCRCRLEQSSTLEGGLVIGLDEYLGVDFTGSGTEY